MSDVIGRRTSMLLCKLTALEIIERQVALVDATRSREVRELALVTWKAERKAEEEVIKGDISHVANDCFRLATVIRNREEAREVEVVDTLDKTEIVSVRTDTGELVARRAATEAERQAALPLEG